MHLNTLIKALKGDPDLASLPPAPCFQVLSTVSGCDYISYFAGFSTGDEEKGRLTVVHQISKKDT